MTVCVYIDCLFNSSIFLSPIVNVLPYPVKADAQYSDSVLILKIKSSIIKVLQNLKYKLTISEDWPRVSIWKIYYGFIGVIPLPETKSCGTSPVSGLSALSTAYL